MPTTDSSFLSIPSASFDAARFSLCAVPTTDFSILSYASASFEVALVPSPMLTAYSSYLSYASASFDAALAPYPMPNAYSSFLSYASASFDAASFSLCAVPTTDSSSDELIGASFEVA